MIPALLLAACGDPSQCVGDAPPAPVARAENVVLVLFDDLGVDRVNAYDMHPLPAPTPSLDALAERGVQFTSAYAEPLCSPSRATLLTGRRPIRHGVGSNVNRKARGLPFDEVTLPEALTELSGDAWTSMAVGKWHLSTIHADAVDDPLEHGFDRFDGLIGNPSESVKHGLETSWTFWEHVVDGELSTSEEYITTAQIDAAIAALDTLPEPFFLYVALSGTHGPLHVPPEDLFDVAVPVDDHSTGDAMIEATDRELGRLLDAIGDRATVIVTSDNGTSRDLVRPPSLTTRAKGSVYPGGSHVPLLIAGPGIEPGVNEGLVHITDLFPTVLELAGLDADALGVALDGTSVVPALSGGPTARRCGVVEIFKSNGRRESAAAFDEAYWLVRPEVGPDELYLRVPSHEPAENLIDSSGSSRRAARRLQALLPDE